jgi:acetyltransferase-like isoleucine patch superfamily enzyme
VKGDATKLYLPDSTKVQGKVIFDNSKGGVIKIGSNCHLMHGVLIVTYGGDIKIGNYSSVNPYSILYGSGGLTIGDDVRIAAHVVIVTSNHNFIDTETPIRRQGITKKGVVIEDDVWIGTNVTILDGVIIEKGSVIAAGSVVNKNIIRGDIVAGIPAKKIKNRYNE